MPLASSIELPERYRVNRHIASGGMASVWEVEDLLLGRTVAVKVLGAQFASDRVARARFQREARTAAQVSAHPNVVTIYDIGEHGEDAFIVMEFYSGGTVADRLKAARDNGTPLDRDTALRWLREAAAGIDAAHAAGVVHRDVKPANLLLDAQSRLAVADFGIARLADDTNMTQAGQVLGTAAYLSPEQATGQPATAASDRYALAVVAYELLSGSRPFDATAAAAQLLQHAEERPPRASASDPGLPLAVDAVLFRGLSKEPARRPATATELVDEIEHALADVPGEDATTRTRPMAAALPPEPVRIEPAPAPERAQAPVRAAAPAAVAPRPARTPSRLPLVAVLAVAAVIVGGAVGMALRSDSGGGNSAGTGARASTTGASARPKTSARPAPAAAASSTPQAPAATATTPAASGGDPAALNDRGFALIGAGDYAGAVAPLKASVEAFRAAGRTSETTYYFALYNLGVALNRSGNPAAAIPYLQERLKFANQTGTVKKELQAAQAQLQGGAAPKGNGKGKKLKD
jgi:serine/threonine-protein kinase